MQVLSVSTDGGLFVSYLAALPSVFASHGVKVASLSSLGEVTLVDVVTRSTTTLQVACEPAFCSLGPGHLAVGINNQVQWARGALTHYVRPFFHFSNNEVQAASVFILVGECDL
jgi:hypothetical protein